MNRVTVVTAKGLLMRVFKDHAKAIEYVTMVYRLQLLDRMTFSDGRVSELYWDENTKSEIWELKQMNVDD